MLARVIGGEHFYPIAEEWIKISLVWFGMLWGGGLTGIGEVGQSGGRGGAN